jgi:hypothetical protein
VLGEEARTNCDVTRFPIASVLLLPSSPMRLLPRPEAQPAAPRGVRRQARQAVVRGAAGADEAAVAGAQESPATFARTAPAPRPSW